MLALAALSRSYKRRMSFDILEKAINEISDKDWSWWPFLWLRPEKHDRFSLRRVVAIAILYGLPCSGLVCLLLRRLAPHAPYATQALFAAALVFPLMFLFIGSVVVGPMWNRRAARIRARAPFLR